MMEAAASLTGKTIKTARGEELGSRISSPSSSAGPSSDTSGSNLVPSSSWPLPEHVLLFWPLLLEYWMARSSSR